MAQCDVTMIPPVGKKQKIKDVSWSDATEIDESRKIVIQFRDALGETVGSQLQLSVTTSRIQLQQLLNQLQESEEPTPYSFKVQGPKGQQIEITEGLTQVLDGLKGVTSETSLDVTFYPLAAFRVRPVTRCTSSLEGHSEAVLCVSFSPDSTLLASGSGDTTVRVWDLQTETPLATLKGHTNWVLAVAWSPTADIIASSGMDKVIKVWNVLGSKSLGSKEVNLKAHTKGITCLAWQPIHLMKDEQNLPHLASAALDSTIRIWDVANGINLLTLSSHTLPVTQIRYSGNIELPCLYSCSRDTSVKVWNTETGQLIHDLKGHGHWVNTMALNTELVTQAGQFDHTLESRDKQDSPRASALKRYKNYLNQCCGGKERLVTGSDDCTMFLWEPLISKKPIARLVGHQKPVNHVQFSPDGRIIASASFDKSIRLWDAVTGAYLAVLRGHVGPVYRIAWSPDSRSIVTASADSTVKVWDVIKRKLREDLPGHADEVFGVDWSIDGGQVATGSKDRILKIWRH